MTSDDPHVPRPSPASKGLFGATASPPIEPLVTVEAGQVLDDFRLEEPIGQGGMGQVWRARQSSLERTVALKLVRPDRVSERTLEYFAREARAGGRLSHPGVVSVYGHGTEGGIAWIAMEYVEGCWTLRDSLDELAVTEEFHAGYYSEAATFCAELADALHAAHDAGVIHRDIKPQNILVTPEEHPKLTDFGLARITDEAALSQTGEFIGTYLYMSPEQVRAVRGELDHRTDIFSFGVVLYEILSGRRPFEGDTATQIAEKILREPPPELRDLRSRIPRDLAVITGKCLEKNPAHRYATMAEVARDLRRHLASEPIVARPPSRARRMSLWTRRNPTKSVAAVIVAAAFAIILGLLLETLAARDAATRSRNTALDRAAEAEAVVAFVEAIFGKLSDWTVNATELRVRDLVDIAATVAPPRESELAYVETQALMGSLLQNLGDLAEASRRYEEVAEMMLAFEQRSYVDDDFAGRDRSFRLTAGATLERAASLALSHAWTTRDAADLSRGEALHARLDELGLELDEVARVNLEFDRALVAELRGDSDLARRTILPMRSGFVAWLRSDDDGKRRLAQSRMVSAAGLLCDWGDHAAAIDWLQPVLEPDVRATLSPQIAGSALWNRTTVAANEGDVEELVRWSRAYVEFVDEHHPVDSPAPILTLPGLWASMINVGVPLHPSAVHPLERWRSASKEFPVAQRAEYLGSLGLAAVVSEDVDLALGVARAMETILDEVGPTEGPHLVLALGSAIRLLEEEGGYAEIAALHDRTSAAIASARGGDYETLRPQLLARGVLALAHQGRADDVDAALVAHALDLASVPEEGLEAAVGRALSAATTDQQRSDLEETGRRILQLGRQ